MYVTYDPAAPVAVEGTRIGTGLTLAMSPNPAPGRVTAAFGLPRADRVDLAVYDAAGRRVKTLIAGTLHAGDHRVQWTGRDEAGNTAAAGIYFVRLRGTEGAIAKKVLLVR